MSDMSEETVVNTNSTLQSSYYDSDYLNINDTSNSSNYINYLLSILRASHNRPLTTEELIKNSLIILCYSVIVALSLCGNLLVVKVIAFGKRKMCTTTNILIASLAVSDIVMTVFNIPFNVARLMLKSWPFGSFLCVSVPFVQVTCVYVSTFTMAVIAFYRWWTLSRTTASKSLTSIQLSLIIGCVWLLAAILAIPHSIFSKTVVIPTQLVRCTVEYPEMDFDFPLWLSVEAFATQYLIPLSITCILYIQIGFIISRQGLLAGKSNDQRKKAQSEARKKRIIMLVLVVGAFSICWLPLNLYHLLVDFSLISRNWTLFIACHWFAMSSV